MSVIKSLWNSRHRQALAVAGAMLGVAVLLGGGLVAWSSARLHDAMLTLDLGQQGLSDAETQAEELTALKSDLDRRESLSRALREAGFLADTDRVAWAEAVSAAASALHPLGYSAVVGTQQWMPLPDDVTAWYATRGLEPPSLHATDLVLHINGLHEDELTSFMQDALAAGAGVTRIEECALTRRTDAIGMDVECTLRRFGIGTRPVTIVAGAQVVEVAQ
ncbi:MAG: hypothetical protein ABI645_02675 [Pseudomonadota bacterium]